MAMSSRVIEQAIAARSSATVLRRLRRIDKDDLWLSGYVKASTRFLLPTVLTSIAVAMPGWTKLSSTV